MLYPEMNASRALIDLSGIWEFQLAQAEGSRKSGQRFHLNTRNILQFRHLTMTRRKEHSSATIMDGQCIRKSWKSRPCLKKERVVLRFGSVTQAARVYLNGTLICTHKVDFFHLRWRSIHIWKKRICYVWQ